MGTAFVALAVYIVYRMGGGEFMFYCGLLGVMAWARL